MPRLGDNTYQQPYPDVAQDTTIASQVYNGFVNDIVQEINKPLPVSRGGTGGTDPASAMANLGGELFAQVVTNYDSFVFAPGSFHSLAGATSAPVTGHAFSGICYQTDAANMFIEVTDQDDVKQPGGKWIRQKRLGAWSLWASMSGSVIISDTPPANPVDSSLWWESDTGTLYVRYNDGDSVQWVVAAPVPDLSVYVQKSGDTMTGPLNVVTPPTQPANAASKAYVDSSVATVAGVAGNAVRYDAAQGLTDPQMLQARQNVYAAPFDALAHNGMQVNGNVEVVQSLGSFFTSAGLITTGNFHYAENWRIAYLHAAGTFNANYGIHAPSAGLLTAPASMFAQANNGNFAQAGLANNDYWMFRTHVEGYRFARMMWGTALAMPLWFGFRFYSSAVAGNLLVRFFNAAGNRIYYRECPVVVGWNWVTGVIPGDTAGTWDKTNGIGLYVDVTVAGKSTTPAAPNAWSTTSVLQSTGSSNFIGATSNMVDVTGLILLPGSSGPVDAQAPLIMRPFDTELTLCQRYYEKSYDYASRPGTVTSGGAARMDVYALQNVQASFVVPWPFKVRKRAAPTVSILSPATGISGNVADLWNSVDVAATVITPGEAGFNWFATAGAVATHLALQAHFIADARF